MVIAAIAATTTPAPNERASATLSKLVRMDTEISIDIVQIHDEIIHHRLA